MHPGGKTSPPHVYALNDYPSLPDAIEAYLREEKPPEKPPERPPVEVETQKYFIDFVGGAMK